MLDKRQDRDRRPYRSVGEYRRDHTYYNKDYGRNMSPAALEHEKKVRGVYAKSEKSVLAEREPYLYEGIFDPDTAGPVDADVQVKKIGLKDVEKLADDLLMRHRYVGVKFIVNRAVTHELVRHRVCSFLQESQRYCNYNKEKFDGQVTFIKPLFFEEDSEKYQLWKTAMEDAEKKYLKLLESASPQASRTVLPNSCKTEIIMYCNLQEWQHIISLRTSKGADPSMREIMIPFAEELKRRYPMM